MFIPLHRGCFFVCCAVVLAKTTATTTTALADKCTGQCIDVDTHVCASGEAPVNFNCAGPVNIQCCGSGLGKLKPTCTSVHPGGECGDTSTQTCSKVPKDSSYVRELVSRAELFADYAKDYTDAAGQPHALCPGSNECCEGGVWGDVKPAGGLVYDDVGAGICEDKDGNGPAEYFEYGPKNDDAWCRYACDRLEACVAYDYRAGGGWCRTYGTGLLEGGAPPGWKYNSGTGGTNLISTSTGSTDYRCHRNQRGGVVPAKTTSPITTAPFDTSATDYNCKQAYPTSTATCVDPKLYTCSGTMEKKGTTDLCTGDLDTLHCCAGTATKIPPGDKLCT